MLVLKISRRVGTKLLRSGRTCARSYHSKTGVYGYRPREKVAYEVSVDVLKSRAEQSNFFRFVTAYRRHGHKRANINPVAISETSTVPELEPRYYGLSENNNFIFNAIISTPVSEGTVADAIDFLNKTYSGTISAEFNYLENTEEEEWFAKRMEQIVQEELDNDMKRQIATEMLKSQAFDNFLATKFVTVKRYGGEGAESMMAFFLEFLNSSARADVQEVVFGMPHRGRLNLLTGMLQFPPAQIFRKLKGMSEFPEMVKASGDVLSHFTSSVDLKIGDKTLHVTLLPGPSHLEAVNPVSMGKTRGRQQSFKEGGYSPESSSQWSDKVLNIQIHGDAAFTGQGVNQETLEISQVPNFEIGGTIHLVVNNQLGFTTPADRGRSSRYCTDLAKMILSPVIHVNGDFPEMVVRATRLACEYQRHFRKDVFVDLNCYRQWGHNELDDPTFTNPAIYSIIQSRRSVPDIYSDSLVEEGVMTKEDVDVIVAEYTSWLNNILKTSDSYIPQETFLRKHWAGIHQADSAITVWDTGVELDILRYVGKRSVTYPEKFVANSILSEEAVLAFEYGMSIENPNRLVMWEAQFGDFFNGAQIPIDTYVTSGETKWMICSGLVMLLPHGYDGAGPEHSSCRLERFLQQSDSNESKPDGDDVNIHISNPTTPAQYFHLLRKQVLQNYRKPLIIVSPKILLRDPCATSDLADMGPQTTYMPVIGDEVKEADKVQRVIFVTGKHYYALDKHRKASDLRDVAIVRLEGLSPFPTLYLQQEVAKYRNAKIFIWSQEEHQNMGAWSFVRPRFENLIGKRLKYAGRRPLATPAVGIGLLHRKEAEEVIMQPFSVR
ncbi:2-oxoadipate dehydrogenase complex component E1 isoform X2 [Periplaneta americana]|uniref:2-oxoadipate dehydrogenase complex component E1 isoform X2 n=1 Tax=Periplaneta americana TaxID=6978 RepID=UPI0037E99634